MKKVSTLYQDAIRIIFLLVNGSQEIKIEENSDIKGVFHGKTRLYALDFWIRYPDYLAYELISLYEDSGNQGYLKIAQNILDNKEPDLKRVPMIRYLFGAYEKLDNILSILISNGLIKQTGKKKENRIVHYDFQLYQKAFDLVEKANKNYQELKWYDERSKLVVEIAGNRSGSALKDKQYERIEYAKTKLGGIIPSIENEVISYLGNYESHAKNESVK